MLFFRTSFFDSDDQRPADDSRPELTTIPPAGPWCDVYHTQQTTAGPSGTTNNSRPELNLRLCALPTDRLDYCNQESAFIYLRNGVSVTGSVLKTEITPRNRKPEKSLNLDDLFFFKKALLLFFAIHNIKNNKKRKRGKYGRKWEIGNCRETSSPAEKPDPVTWWNSCKLWRSPIDICEKKSIFFHFSPT